MKELLAAAEAFDQRGVLGRGFGVVPQLGRPDDLAMLVQDHKAMLLSTDAERPHRHRGRPRRRQRTKHRTAQRVHPPGRILLPRTGRPLHKRMPGVAAALRRPTFIHQQGLGPLRSQSMPRYISRVRTQLRDAGEGRLRGA